MIKKPKVLKIKKCPVCGSLKREFKFNVTRDGIKSEIYECLNCCVVYNGIKLLERFDSKNLENKFVVGGYEKKYAKWFKYGLSYLKSIPNFPFIGSPTSIIS